MRWIYGVPLLALPFPLLVPSTVGALVVLLLVVWALYIIITIRLKPKLIALMPQQPTMESLIATLAIHDVYAYGHSERVAVLASRLAVHMGLDQEVVSLLWHAGRLHDMGKIGVPQHLLAKDGKLSPKEYEKVKSHAALGEIILSRRPEWREMALVVGQHHEWFNGRGYPRGLRGEEIRLEARILAVVDAYDAMTTNRSYSRAKDPGDALVELLAATGAQFDPYVTRCFVHMMRDDLQQHRWAPERAHA